jgi:serine/threonine protein kinase
MIIKYAEHGDLRNYIYKFFPKLTWTDRAKILIELSKALNSLHQMNLLHRDFHCKNILVDKEDRIFISDFGLCQPIDAKLGNNNISTFLYCFMIYFSLLHFYNILITSLLTIKIQITFKEFYLISLLKS